MAEYSRRTDKKDELTEQLRQMIGRSTSELYETNRAETCLSTLSFQSKAYPQKTRLD